MVQRCTEGGSRCREYLKAGERAGRVLVLCRAAAAPVLSAAGLTTPVLLLPLNPRPLATPRFTKTGASSLRQLIC